MNRDLKSFYLSIIQAGSDQFQLVGAGLANECLGTLDGFVSPAVFDRHIETFAGITGNSKAALSEQILAV